MFGFANSFCFLLLSYCDCLLMFFCACCWSQDFHCLAIFFFVFFERKELFCQCDSDAGDFVEEKFVEVTKIVADESSGSSKYGEMNFDHVGLQNRGNRISTARLTPRTNIL